MKIILNISFYVKGEGLRLQLKKEYNTDLYPPNREIAIEDSAWKNPKAPTTITCNFDDKHYCLDFPIVELDTEQEYKDEIKMYVSHDWKYVVDDFSI
jgi:hypothetical protein